MVEFSAKAIVEIAGSPKEFVGKTMDLLLQAISKDDELTLKHKEKFEPKQTEKLWSTFAELELGFKGVKELVHFCFKYMPSHFEIESPPRIELRREELADVLNDLLMNLHKMDEIVKDVKSRHKLVEDANKILLKNSLAMALGEGPLTPDEISKKTGINQPQLGSILEYYENKGLLAQKGKKYKLK